MSLRVARALAAPLVGLAIANACGPVDPPPDDDTPRNRCPCGDFKTTSPRPSCSGGICVANGSIDGLTISVSIPGSAELSASATVVLPYADLIANRFTAARPGCQPPSCVVVPQLLSVRGMYYVSPAIDAQVNRDLQHSGSSPVAIPSHVSFHPLWPPQANGPYADARATILPLAPVYARPTDEVTTLGPANTTGTGWLGAVMPGVYEAVVEPDPPFDDALPPLLKTALVAANTDDRTDQIRKPTAAVDAQPDLRTVRVYRDNFGGGATSLEGWTTYLADATSRRRVSQRVTLHGAGGDVTYNTIGRPVLTNTVLIIAPPAGPDGEGLPTLVDNVGPTTLGAEERYPALPPPVDVSGVVMGPDAQLVEADLVLRERRPGAIVTSRQNDRARNAIGYTTTTRTVAGRWRVLLPEGDYDVFVAPLAETGFATTTVPLPLQRDQPRQAGKQIMVLPPVPLHGTCVIDDGRPLAHARVEAHPSTLLAGVVDRERWPHGATTTADASGAFSLPVGPGTYDVFVQPAEGSGLPWAVATGKVVDGAPVSLGTIVVRAPVKYDLTLRDVQGGAVTGAIVRAFAPASPASPTSPTNPPVGDASSEAGAGAADAGATSPAPTAPPLVPPFVEIGHGVTDASGRVVMLLTPPQ